MILSITFSSWLLLLCGKAIDFYVYPEFGYIIDFLISSNKMLIVSNFLVENLSITHTNVYVYYVYINIYVKRGTKRKRIYFFLLSFCIVLDHKTAIVFIVEISFCLQIFIYLSSFS